MAVMLPNKPKAYQLNSLEGIIFDKLSILSDDYYIFHSFEINKISDRKNYDFEIDFLIVHPSKGVIVLEAKAGAIRYENNQWLYSNGTPMSHDGPFNQAKNNMYELIKHIKRKNDPYDILLSCDFYHAVCFPSIKDGVINNIYLPANAPRDIIVTYDDLEQISITIDRIFKFNNQNNTTKKELNEVQFKYLINNILSPKFNLIPSMDVITKENRNKFNKMIEEQVVILDFLNYQKTATISGAAGTGKTMLAIEKARRLSEIGNKVLFLCYNKELNENLRTYHSNYNVDYYTLDSFSKKVTGDFDQTYEKLENYLTEIYANEKDFDYDDIIIDEGQDFGLENIGEQRIVEVLDLIIKNKKGNFYIFYDKNQLVNSSTIPNYITNSDCRITLYKNCRNTIKIANTSLKLIDIKPELFENALIGVEPKLRLIKNSDDQYSELNELIDYYKNQDYQDIVILSLKSYTNSFLYKKYKDNFYLYKNKEYKWTTARKFKGLEADVIILVDVDDFIFSDDKLLFYVGASRAKLELAIIAEISNKVIEDNIIINNPSYKRYNIEKIISMYFNVTQ